MLWIFGIFFNKQADIETDEKIAEKQNIFLLEEVRREASGDTKYLRFLFSVIATFKSSRKLKFYQIFLETNQNFDDFEMLPFEPTFSSWSGSRVPILQQQLEFYGSIVSMCNSVRFLKQRQFIEQIILDLRQQILNEKKRDFTEEH